MDDLVKRLRRTPSMVVLVLVLVTVLSYFLLGDFSIHGNFILDNFAADESFKEETMYENVDVSEGVIGIQFKGDFEGEYFEIYVDDDIKYRVKGYAPIDYVHDLSGSEGVVIFEFKYKGLLLHPTKRVIEAEESVIIDKAKIERDMVSVDVVPKKRKEKVVEEEEEVVVVEKKFGVLAGGSFGGGNGSVGNPYLIEDCADLQAMNGSLSSHYALAGDIDCDVSRY